MCWIFLSPRQRADVPSGPPDERAGAPGCSRRWPGPGRRREKCQTVPAFSGVKVELLSLAKETQGEMGGTGGRRIVTLLELV